MISSRQKKDFIERNYINQLSLFAFKNWKYRLTEMTRYIDGIQLISASYENSIFKMAEKNQVVQPFLRQTGPSFSCDPPSRLGSV